MLMDKNLRFAFCITLFLGWLSLGQAFAQSQASSAYQTGGSQVYWVFFQDTVRTPICISLAAAENRKMLGLPVLQSTDAPIEQHRIKQVASRVTTLRQKSRWLYAVSVEATEAQIREVQVLSCVKGVKKIKSQSVVATVTQDPTSETSTSSEVVDKGTAAVELMRPIRMMSAKDWVVNGPTGKSVTVGIVDCGFAAADIDPYLNQYVKEGRVLHYRDFLTPTNQNPFANFTSLDFHGRRVWACIAGIAKDEETGEVSQLGLGTGINVVLARTDHGDRERRSEEDNWVAALEWMDSLGVRLVNSSLGYTDAFDSDADDYSTSQMDGKTSVVAKFATKAVKEKGMILLVAAGNEGAARWKIVGTPGDCEAVISVGAFDESMGKANYSSEGNPSVDFVKPEIAAWSADGTSFSTPTITGLVACMLEKKPTLTCAEVKNLLERSAHAYPFANSHVGYGMPQCPRMEQLLNGKRVGEAIKIKSSKKEVKVEFSADIPVGQSVWIYHKAGDFKVESVEVKEGRGTRFIKLKRPENIDASTVMTGYAVREVIWK